MSLTSRLGLTVLAALVLALVARSMPDLARYLKIREM